MKIKIFLWGEESSMAEKKLWGGKYYGKKIMGGKANISV